MLNAILYWGTNKRTRNCLNVFTAVNVIVVFFQLSDLIN